MTIGTVSIPNFISSKFSFENLYLLMFLVGYGLDLRQKVESSFGLRHFYAIRAPERIFEPIQSPYQDSLDYSASPNFLQ